MNVLLGVTGGIAAYKSAYLVSLLKKSNMAVDVLMTPAATEFVAPLTFETLSAAPVTVEMFRRDRPFEVEHIALAKKADIAILAPASANTVAKLACGIADNMLTTVFLALTCPVIIAPAMNTAMFENAATQVNLQILRDRGYYVMPPGVGELACGDTGAGRMREPEEILSFLREVAEVKSNLADKKVLITAGPTCEAIDPVRFISNRSSGKMGYALARQALGMGAEVTLLSGPVALEPPRGAEAVRVISAQQMYDEAMRLKKSADIVIACAAVSDYAPVGVSDHKMKKQETLTIELEKTKDILAELGRKKSYYLVGFAAETRDVEQYAHEKLKKKNLDMIVANDVSGSETGFESDCNEVLILKKDAETILVEKDTKDAIAKRILLEIAADLRGEK